MDEKNTDFMKEEIRQRPVNKKRLLRRTAITVFLAVLFGAVACTVFLRLEPVINNAINPSEEPAPVTFPEETQHQVYQTLLMIPQDRLHFEKDRAGKRWDRKRWKLPAPTAMLTT